uniref:Peptidase S49 domain-containing protein n=1 Tax=Amphora coffeiformis TaxID=265554 RepID=A0A7S3P7S4_9STRA|mmetsp:Transcript_12429/g.23801  ORF Transcript_12429/g.23801 Transcript_12429/m.23801 type:complete len:759 (+) Transcript_12429:204-2480(+)
MSQTTLAAKGRFARMVHSAGRTFKTALAVGGVAAVGAAYVEYKALCPVWEDGNSTSVFSSAYSSLFEASQQKKEDDNSNNIAESGETNNSGKKKKALVIPFNRLKLVERKRKSFESFLEKLNEENKDIASEMEIRELVDLIHKAAADPEISALYGIFGHGTSLMTAGWANLEEVRNALRVFRESHRRHAEPNLGHEQLLVPRVDRKPMYAYTDTFASIADPGNKDYYIASVFTHVHMQKTGELNLFGLTSEQFFLRGLLEKYGINVHVFKHGKYKNAPNALTEWGFNKAHRENVTNILEQLNADVCYDIQAVRSKALLTSWLRKDGDIWRLIQNAGTFPARTAWKSGLVDYIPRRSPLFDLVEANLEKSNKEDFKSTWKHQETDFDRFPASEMVELKDYAKKLSKKKKAEDRMQRWHDFAKKTRQALSSMGSLPKESVQKPRDQVALLQIQGAIGDGTASKVLKQLQKIQKEESAKCLVVRVTSPGGSIQACETISQELKALKIPVVFSFGNVSASGGYYIASCADRIFASKKTVTGSIGVFGIRPDFTDFVARYGISCEHVSSGDYSATWTPFHPMTSKMKENFAQSIDRYYKQFKGVVADGRGLSLEAVENIGQGRVWTGQQAKANGLVDEIGGLYRALAYAKREFTSGDADVVVFPKEQSFFQKLAESMGEQKSLAEVAAVLSEWMASGGTFQERAENVNVDLLSNQLLRVLQDPTTSGKLTGGVLMVADENTAIRLLMEESGIHQPLPPDDFWR